MTPDVYIATLRAEAAEVAREASTMTDPVARAAEFAYANGLLDAASLLEFGTSARKERSLPVPRALHLRLVKS